MRLGRHRLLSRSNQAPERILMLKRQWNISGVSTKCTPFKRGCLKDNSDPTKRLFKAAESMIYTVRLP